MRTTVAATQVRLSEIERQGKKIYFMNLEGATTEESSKARLDFFEILKPCPPSSVLFYINAKNNNYSPQEARAWKAGLELLNEKLLKTAIVGLSPIAKMTLMGVRAYARLLGIEKKSIQAEIFSSEDKAFDYLCQD